MRLRSLIWLSALITCVAVAVPQARADLVNNGGFDTGDFTGWTFDQSQYDLALIGVSTDNVRSPDFSAFLGPVGSTSTLSQTLATTPGTTYHVSFWLTLPFNDNNTPNFFSASFGGVTPPTLPLIDSSSAFAYTQFGFDVTAPTANTDLLFTFRNDPHYWYLDDVSVNAVASVPGPLAGAGLPGLLAGFSAVLVWYRKKRAAV